MANGSGAGGNGSQRPLVPPKVSSPCLLAQQHTTNATCAVYERRGKHHGCIDHSATGFLCARRASLCCLLPSFRFSETNRVRVSVQLFCRRCCLGKHSKVEILN